MRKMNRLFAMLAAFAMTAAMFAGCGMEAPAEETLAAMGQEEETELPSENMGFMAPAEEETTEKEENEVAEATEGTAEEISCTPVYATVFADVAVLSLEPLEEYDSMFPNERSEDISEGGRIAQGCTYGEETLITQVVVLDELVPCSTRYWFEGLVNLETIVGLEKVNTAYVTDMSGMFFNCGIRELDLSVLDTSKVTDMERFMALGEYVAENSPIASRRISFEGCDLRNVTSAREMFERNVTLEAVDFTGTGFAPENMREMFVYCGGLREVRGLNTCNAVDLSQAFFDCGSLEVLDVEWDFAKAEHMGSMLEGCESLKELDVSDWRFGMPVRMWNLFSGCRSLTELDVSGWNMTNALNVEGMFAGCSGLTTLDVANWDLSNAQVSQLSSHKDYGMGMFENCVSLKSLDLSNWETKGFVDMSYMFRNCTSLETVGDLSGWHTGNTVGMTRMFAGCANLKTVGDISGWKTVRLEWSGYMFEGCDSLDQIPDWYTPQE